MPPPGSCKQIFSPVGKVGWVDSSFLWHFPSALCRYWVFKSQNFPVTSQLTTKASFLISLFKKKKKKVELVIFVSLLRPQYSSFLFLYRKKKWKQQSFFLFLHRKKNQKWTDFELFHGKLQLPGNFMTSFVPSVDMVCGCRRESTRFCASSPTSNIRTFPFLNYCFTKVFPNLVRRGRDIFLSKWLYPEMTVHLMLAYVCCAGNLCPVCYVFSCCQRMKASIWSLESNKQWSCSRSHLWLL